MILKLILLVILLTIILIIIVIPVVNLNKELKGKDEMVSYTLELISRLGKIINLLGLPGAGKTLTMTMLGHAYTILLQEELQKRLDNIVKRYVNFDFNHISGKLDYEFSEGNIDYKRIYRDLFGNLVGIHYDFLNMRSVRKDLLDYIRYYYILNYRNNYIMSTYYVFNRITMTRSKELDLETLNIKNICKTHKYSLDEGVIALLDERNIDNGNNKSNSKEVKTSGLKELYSLIRQLYEDLNRIITTKQVKEDEYIGTRRLEMSSIKLNKCNEIIYDFKFLQRKIDRWLSFLYKLFKFKYSFIVGRKKRTRAINRAYLKANCWYRKKEYFWNGVKCFLRSQGLLVINCNISNENGDFKQEDEEEPIELFFPVEWGYGTYETHDYACLHEVLQEMSNTSFEKAPYNIRFNTMEKRKQKSKILFENLKEDKEEKGDVEDICF